MRLYQFKFEMLDRVTAASRKIMGAFGGVERAAAASRAAVRGVGGSVPGVNATERAVRNLEAAVAGVSRRVGGMRNRFDGALSGIKGQLIGVASIAGGIMLGSNIVQTTANYEGLTNAIRFASGSAESFESNMAFVNKTVDSMGLPLQKTSEGFKTLLGSTMGGPLKSNVQDMFRGISTGVSVLGLSEEAAERVFLAVGQIASKGKVQAEELRGQIGEALPGAFGIAAKAMGVTEAQLNKIMETGKLTATDFLPKFAAQMEKTFGPGLLTSVNAARANFNRYNTEMMRAKMAFGTVLLPFIIEGVKKLTSLLKDIQGFIVDNKAGLVSFFEFVSSVISTTFSAIGKFLSGVIWVWNEYSGVIKAAGNAILIYAGLLGGVMLVVQAYSLYVTIASFLTGGWTTAMYALGTAILANPIGWLIGLIAVLSASIIYAWNNFDGFRGFIVGMWGVFKEFGSIVMDYLVSPVLAFGKVLHGVLTMNSDMIAEGMADGMKAAQKILSAGGLTHRIKGAYELGDIQGAGTDKKIDPLGMAVSKLMGDSGKPITKSVYDAGKGDNAAPSPPGGGFSATDTGTGKGDGNGISGSAPKHITINIGKLIETQAFHTSNLQESASKIKDAVLDALTGALNQVNYSN